ncbi:MAG: hypothetical protein A3F17_08195 [Gammaproteobacteria bacterium RIFCSPHIGHO2_12_FULL_41_15]|nr:MAG: hypothetical protein A3F17_08195 [Gammaproteobacteria bacterium RIFCSPHIGHO2_12_FULL_41_15]
MPALRPLLKGSAIVIATGWLTACAPHLNQQQCETMDWYQVGYSDGTAGKYQRDLTGAITDCAKFKLTVNAQAYSKGWSTGVRKFCKPDTAFQLGVNGQVYNNICPSDLSAAFASAWQQGLRRYCVPETGYNLGRSGAAFPEFCPPDKVVAFRNAYASGRRVFTTVQGIDAEIQSLNNKINGLTHQIDDIQKQINGLNAQLTTGPISPNERSRINYQIRNLNDQIMQFRDQISRLQSQQTRLKQQQLDIASH